MADLAENAAASLLGIVHPMIGGNVAGIHAIVDEPVARGSRTKIVSVADGHGRESAIEADHQPGDAGRSTIGRRHCAHDCCEFGFVQAKRLFAEDRFPRVEGGERLARMKMVAGGDQHRVDFRILQKFVFRIRAVGETELLGSAPAARSGRIADADERNARNLFQRGQERVLRELPAPRTPKPNEIRPSFRNVVECDGASPR